MTDEELQELKHMVRAYHDARQTDEELRKLINQRPADLTMLKLMVRAYHDTQQMDYGDRLLVMGSIVSLVERHIADAEKETK